MNKWLLMLLFTCASTQAAEHGVKELSPGRLLLNEGEMAVSLGPAPAKIERVLIIIHGRLRNAETYRQSAERAAELAGQSASTLVIAPQFLNETDIALHPRRPLRWRSGGAAICVAGPRATGLDGRRREASLRGRQPFVLCVFQ